MKRKSHLGGYGTIFSLSNWARLTFSYSFQINYKKDVILFFHSCAMYQCPFFSFIYLMKGCEILVSWVKRLSFSRENLKARNPNWSDGSVWRGSNENTWIRKYYWNGASNWTTSFLSVFNKSFYFIQSTSCPVDRQQIESDISSTALLCEIF